MSRGTLAARGKCSARRLGRADFNGELRTHKPVLLYWCIMAVVPGAWRQRVCRPAAERARAIGSCLCVYLMGRRLFSPQAGVWAGIALATSLMFVVAGTGGDARFAAHLLQHAGDHDLRLRHVSTAV